MKTPHIKVPTDISKKTISKSISKLSRGGAVLAAAVLSLGSTGADAAANQAFVANAPDLSPAAVGAPKADPIVVRRIVKVQPEPEPQPVAQPAVQQGGGGCGLDTIKQRESGGDYRAQNSSSSASGAYQVIDGTWGGYGGYQRAGDAPKNVQDKFAQSLYAKHGSSPWIVC
ncbi:MAG: transglycosylase family protein [bacterium]|nr:transglycosylase family protein [bacterium]MDZ4248027.1 transglycosylase family protein [Patescibacteria group bacterium]